ncbi:MAG: ABC transporter substrate-binding protein [Anaerolineales bacterium]
MATKSDRIHPGVIRAQDKLADGRMSRRDFLRIATLLGVSAPTAYVLAACGVPATTAPTAIAATNAPAATAMPATAASSIKRGGILKVAIQVPKVDHPARFSWVFDSNEFRMIFEYLTETGGDNITRPYLAEKWEASDDLKEWTLHLRKDVKWYDPVKQALADPFVANDVLYNFKTWLDVDTKSSILGLWTGILTIDNVKVVDDNTIKLQLDAPKLDVPETLFHYPAQIVHPSFDGDATTGKNWGTGPYALKEYKAAERVIVHRREGYYLNGEDGQPLPYLDEIQFLDLGEDQTAWVPALQSGQVHSAFNIAPETYLALKDSKNVTITPSHTSQVRLLRIRVDQDPWTNPDVRNALKMVQDRQKILDTAYFGQGLLGSDVHVAPVQPEYYPMDAPKYDPDGAKALLTKAGLSSLDVSIAVGTGWSDIVAYITTLKEDAKAAGINVTLNTMPNSDYWNLWTETTVGVTPWTHRPLAVMLLPLAYIADADGKPVPWNETRWVDPEFSTLLAKAQGTLDVEARKAIMKDIENIMATRGPIGIAWWQDIWRPANPGFQNMGSHPTDYFLWRDVWYDPDKNPIKS